MLFLKSFIRTLIRHKAFTFINLFGLTFSLSFILLIGTYLMQEKSFDRFHKNIDQIYLVLDSATNDATIDYRVKQMLRDNLPGVQDASIFLPGKADLNYHDKVWPQEKIVSVDNDFFHFFNLQILRGNNNRPFTGLDEALISISLGKKIFGNEDPIGKRVTFNHEIPLTISGIVEDIPENSSLQGNFFVNADNPKMHFLRSCSDMKEGESPENTCSMLFNVFVQLQKSADPSSIEKRSRAVIPHDSRFPSSVKLFPLKDYHFSQQIHSPTMKQGNPALLKILGGIVLIIALLALINYINLTTASYKIRMKETGVKKGLGAQRKTIIMEYLLESVIMVIVAAYLSTFLGSLLLPGFNNFLHVNLAITVFTKPEMFLLFFLLSLLLGILAGIYPALYLSMISPREVLASGVFTMRSGKPVRNILNIFQFTIAIILITVIFFMQKQIQFVKHQDLGFKTEKLLRLNIGMQSPSTIKLLEDRLRSDPGVLDLSATNGVPGDISWNMNEYSAIFIDSHFYSTFGIDVVDGRRLLPGDVNKACLINETAWRKFDDGVYLGKKVHEMDVAGIVKDFHVSSMHTKIESVVLCISDRITPNNITLRIAGNNISRVMNFISKVWKEECPDYPFQYNFYDQWFDSMYKSEEDLGKLISLFAVLAIAISSMGILGLALFATEQRSKEIGIRKVSGATSGQVMLLLSKDFTKWILISFIIGAPISYYAVDKWLENFAYHTHMSWWVFALAGLIALMVALLTVSIQSWRAANRNPIEALRYE